MVTETEDKFDISCESAYSIIHEGLGYHEICARCVPKEFTNEHKQAHVEMCMQFLQQYCEEGEAFLQTDSQVMKHVCITINLQANIKA